MGRKWTSDEDAQLTELVSVHGKQWALIASKMPGRAPCQVASRWNKCLDPRLTKGAFTRKEDEIIIGYVTECGACQWPKLCERLPNRSPKQCRERWFNHLDPSVIGVSWTPEEDLVILRQVERFGPKWSQISLILPGRSDNAVKNRWNSSISKRIRHDSSGRSYLAKQYRQGHIVQIGLASSARATLPHPPPVTGGAADSGEVERLGSSANESVSLPPMPDLRPPSPGYDFGPPSPTFGFVSSGNSTPLPGSFLDKDFL